MKIEDYLVEIKQRGYKCLKCSYKWVPRKKKGKPQICPKCKRRNWDRKKKIRK